MESEKMTLLCKCNWCGNVVEYTPEIKSLEFDGSKYHYCKDCVTDVTFALTVGKNGEQGKYKQISDLWTELFTEITRWYHAPRLPIAHKELEKAILNFGHQLDKLTARCKE